MRTSNLSWRNRASPSRRLGVSKYPDLTLFHFFDHQLVLSGAEGEFDQPSSFLFSLTGFCHLTLEITLISSTFPASLVLDKTSYIRLVVVMFVQVVFQKFKDTSNWWNSPILHLSLCKCGMDDLF